MSGAEQSPTAPHMQHEMARDAAAGGHVGPGMEAVSSAAPPPGVPPGAPPPAGHEQAFQQQILQLKMQQQMQQQKLLQHYQVQQQQLAEQHEAQLRHHLKELWEHQKAHEDREREQREKERLEALRRKDKHDHSAVASTEVKQKLQVFLMKKREQAATNGTSPGSPYRNWGVVKSSSGESLPLGSSCSHPYRIPQSQQHPHAHTQAIGKYDSDFPLRKTASEPNLLKVRLKQRVIERRASPMARRHDRLLANIKRKNIANCTVNSSPDSGPNSPPALTSRGSPTSAPIQEENEETGYGGLASGSHQGSLSDLSLFSSPSMPNISLGRPHIQASTTDSPMLATVSEAKVRAAFTARLGVPLTGQMLPGTLPYYPSLPVIEAEYSGPHKQMQALEQRPSIVTSIYGHPITDTQVAHARLNKAGHRPLGRTQSAPLPLGHPMLTGQSLALGPTHYEEYTQAEKQALDHSKLKQHIRQTVLTRVASGRQEPPVGSHSTSDSSEVIDLTDKKISQHDDHDMMKQQQRDREALQQKRDLMMRHTLQVSEDSAYSCSGNIARPLARALSSPLVHLGPLQSGQLLHVNSDLDITPPVNLSIPRRKLTGSPHKLTTGLAFDNLMLKHACRCGDNSLHPEHGGRLQSVWARLLETGLVSRCDRVRSRKATLEEIQTCHSETHALLFGTNPLNRQKLDMGKLSQLPIKSFVRLQCGGVGVDSDTTWNELYTGPAARMAAGCVIDLAFKAATGDIRNGFAVVRPPGHHAEPEQAMGFCFFNSVAIAAALLKHRLNMQKILIVDWDVHHGNGTQQIFYEDQRVLYLSIHRHDDGNFFPGTGGPTECGSGEGLGYNVNVAWSGGLNPPLGDAEYLAAFRTIVMPIARDFAPDLVLVSAGFDAALGHPAPLGGYMVTPACFGQMTKELLAIADGKVVLSLEGGYDLPAICDSAQECVRALLGDEPSRISDEELSRPPCQNAIDTLQKTIAIQAPHWPCIKQSAHTVGLSAVIATRKELEETDTVTAMAGLSMQPLHINHTPDRSREVSEEPMEQDEIK